MSKVVLLDADGVLLNFDKRYRQEIHRITGYAVNENDVVTWDYTQCPFFQTLAERMPHLSGTLAASVRVAGWGLSIEAYPEAIDAVKQLQSLADVHVVTAPWRPHPTWTNERERVLWNYFNIPAQNVHHSNKKWLFDGDMLVDDKCSHIDEWSDRFVGVPVLFERVYNMNDTPSNPQVVKTNNWDTIINLVKQL